MVYQRFVCATRARAARPHASEGIIVVSVTVPASSSSPRARARRRRAVGLLAASALAAIGAAGIASPREAHAEDLQRRHHWYYRNLFAARINPLGLFNELRFGYRYRTYQALPTILRESYLGANAVLTLSPAWARVGATVEWQPLAVLNLNATYEFSGYFRTFNTIQGYRDVNANFSEQAQRDSTANSYATIGHVVTLGATLQVRAGSLVVRSVNRAMYNDFALRDGATLFYDILLDMLTPNKSWVFTSDNDLALIPEGPGFGFGIRTTVTHAFYDPAVHGTAMSAEALRNTTTLRLGPIFTYNFYEANHARFNAPMLYVVVNWWAMHRYRTGAPETLQTGSTAADYTTQALPYIAIGFSFRGDLFLPPPVVRRNGG